MNAPWKTSCSVLLLALCAFAGDKIDRTNPVSDVKSRATSEIKIDQVGYFPNAPKIALFVGAPADTFSVVNADTGKPSISGKFRPAVLDPDTGDRVQEADFTALTTPGTYYLEVPGVGRSWKFQIAHDIYARAFYDVMRGFYGQRCGMAVDMAPRFPRYKHPACHLHGEFHVSSGKQGIRNNIGGWHDAGDYGRYTVNSGISTGSLLWAYELFTEKVKDRRLDIPESGDGIPDILNEARWNIEWILQMQDVDGGAWHKQTSSKFPDFILPQDDLLPSLVIGTGSAPFKSTCATADLAAVSAIAARVYVPFDRDFASRNLVAARKAWAWIEKSPNVTFHNPPGISTGEYGDSDCSDEILWAAAELWRTTGDEQYQHFFLSHYREHLPSIGSASPDSWAQLGPMAMWTYVLAAREKNQIAVDEITKVSVAAAREIVRRTRQNPYHVSLMAKDYVWGSNGLAAQYGFQLLVTNALAPDPDFVTVALDNLHYLFGRNTFSLCWITQLGENPFRHPHHRPSVAMGDREPWPGLLSGGPNRNRQDAVLKALPELPPAKVYADDKDSYASNEIAINWQAALAFLLAGELQR